VVQRHVRRRALHDEFASELTCGVCLEIDPQPFRCFNGHPVCGDCLTTLVSCRTSSCPTCRATSGYMRDRLTARFATRSGVHHRCGACGSSVALHDAVAHREECDRVRHICFVPDCAFMGAHRELARHMRMHAEVARSTPPGWVVVVPEAHETAGTPATLFVCFAHGFELLVADASDTVVHLTFKPGDAGGCDVFARSTRSVDVQLREYDAATATRASRRAADDDDDGSRRGTEHAPFASARFRARPRRAMVHRMLPRCEADLVDVQHGILWRWTPSLATFDAAHGAITSDALRRTLCIRHGVRCSPVSPTEYHRATHDTTPVHLVGLRVGALDDGEPSTGGA